MTRKRYSGVILAGGKGTRMLPFSRIQPKPTLKIGNEPLIRHQIKAMCGLGVEEIFVLIGHRGAEVMRAAGDGSEFGVRLTFVEQGPDVAGTADALGKLEPHVHSPFVLFLGDIFFIAEDLGSIFETFERENLGAVLLTRLETSREALRENFAVIEGSDHLVERVIEKPRDSPTMLKGCGLYLFGPEIFDAVRRTPRTPLRDEREITESIQIMIGAGGRVGHMPLIKDDININTPQDYLRGNCRLLESLGVGSILGRNTSVPPGSVLERAVLGDNVTMTRPLHLKRCVVLDNAVIPSAGEAGFEDMIIGPGMTFKC
ncbi:MAG: sugar phosphate nucleotidyltransferase [Elusimicrobiota bacterium]